MREYIYEPIKDSDGVDCYIKRGELVRCKDCQYLEIRCADNHGHIPYWCTNLNIYSEGGTWFCADGERREKDG